MRITLIACFVALAVGKALSLFEPTTDYCAIGSCYQGPHIACGNDRKFGTNCTVDAKVVAMSNKLKKYILRKINTWRNHVARGGFHGFGPAVRMATVSWDDELAYLAELNVRQCMMHQDACRNTKRYKKAGQSIAYMGFTGEIPTNEDILLEQLSLWFHEYVDVTMDDIISYQWPEKDEKTTNFAQMMQDKSDAVGCAVVTQTRNDWLQHFLVCNFAVITRINAPIYETGDHAGAGCKTGGNPNYTSLCSTNEQYNDSDAEVSTQKEEKVIKAKRKATLPVKEEKEEEREDEEEKGKEDDEENPAENQDDEEKEGKKENEEPAKKSIFDNFLTQLGRQAKNVKKLNLDVQSIGQQHVNRDYITFDNRKKTRSKSKSK